MKGSGIGTVEGRLTVIVLLILLALNLTLLRRDYCKSYELKVYATGRSAANCNVKEDSASLCTQLG